MHRVDHQDMAAATKAMAAAVEAMAAVVAGLVVAEVLVDTADAAATPKSESLYHSDSWIRFCSKYAYVQYGRHTGNIHVTHVFAVLLSAFCIQSQLLS